MVSIGSENAKNIQYCKPIFLSLIADLFHHFNQVSYSRMHENQTSAGMWHSRPPRDPPPFMAKTILNFHFDYLTPTLSFIICTKLQQVVWFGKILSQLGPPHKLICVSFERGEWRTRQGNDRTWD